MRMKILFAVVVVVFFFGKEVSAALQPPRKSFSVKVILDPTIACGKRPVMDNSYGSGSKTASVRDAVLGAWPWLASLQAPLDNKGNYAHTCGGFIINQWWVVTAGHCTKIIIANFKDWRIVLGATRNSKPGPEVVIRRIAKAIPHHGYNQTTSANDIGVLKMDEAVTYSNYVQPACLLPKEAVMEDVTECYIAGWGTLKEKAWVGSDILQEAKVKIIEMKTCNSSHWYKGEVGKYNLCAGYEKGGVDSCQSDRGGPLMCRKPETELYSVVGVTSWASGCGKSRSPGIYTSTQYFFDWVHINTMVSI